MGLACWIIRERIGVINVAYSIVRQAGFQLKDHTLMLIWSGWKAGDIEDIPNLYWLAEKLSSRPPPLAAFRPCQR